MSNALMLGKVKDGRLVPLADGAVEGGSRLTRIASFTSTPPESQEIHVAEHEGKVLLVRGEHRGGWIYAASIVEVAGPILSITAEQVFGRGGPSGRGRSCWYGRRSGSS